MIKLFTTLVSAFVLFVVTWVFGPAGEPVNIAQKHPQIVRPGESFVIELTVQKGGISGFARLQQFLPAGFTAEPIETQGAQFIDEDQNIKFIWTQLPSDPTFTVSYRVQVAPNASGLKVMNGLFSYIENNKTQKVSIDPSEITLGNPLADANAGTQPQVSRKLIAVRPESGEYKVEITIQQSALANSARFVDYIPDGCTATVIDSRGAKFTFENQKAEFNWSRLPSDKSFTISYAVKSNRPAVTPVIDGMFVYGDDSLNETPELTEEVAAETEAAETATAETVTEKTSAVAEATAAAQSIDMNPVVAPSPVISLPAPQSGIFFKVQIAATRRSPVRNTPWFRKNCKITDEVALMEHEGWRKYVIGHFNTYKEATHAKKVTREKIKDAFVVAYMDGQRIDVRQALKSNSINQ